MRGGIDMMTGWTGLRMTLTQNNPIPRAANSTVTTHAAMMPARTPLLIPVHDIQSGMYLRFYQIPDPDLKGTEQQRNMSA